MDSFKIFFIQISFKSDLTFINKENELSFVNPVEVHTHHLYKNLGSIHWNPSFYSTISLLNPLNTL